jgi:hypothetical protein
MGAPTSDVGYTSATTRREYHKVYMDMWWHWEEEKKLWKTAEVSRKLSGS